jgi:predicted alpha/beta superfamily hydrolase
MENLPLVTIPATHQHLVKAAAIDQNYLVSVALPYGYEENSDQHYPTIYVMDGHWYFGMVVDMVRIMNTPVPFCNELPDAIIVGVGYPDGVTLIEKRNEIGQRRMRDFSPLKDQSLEEWHWSVFPASKNQPSGGANAFLEFLRGELIPLIESSYRVDPSNRCLLGHSPVEFIRFDGHLDKIQVNRWNGKNTIGNSRNRRFG